VRHGRIQDQLIDFACGLSWADVPKTTGDILKLSLLDWASVALAGLDEPVSVALREIVHAEGGQGQALVFASDVAVPARAAALANGAISHALDYDDTHFLHIGHPAVVVFSAALAVAQQQGATGRAFLEAALAGYETSCRIGHWLGRGHYEAGFHMTATAGCFGATIAAARLLGADYAQMVSALGLASTRASGLKAQFGSMGKPYNAGMAAAGGVEAAMLAIAGLTSDTKGLESFAAGHSGAMDATALDGMGQVYVSEAVSHKFHACCHGTHAALEALAKLDVVANDVSKVLVTVHPRWLKVCNLAEPVSGLEAKFSYRMCFAFALAGLDTGALATFSDANCADGRMTALRDLVTVQGNSRLADGAAQVEVEFHRADRQRANYSLDQPQALSERSVRVQRKAAALIGDVRAQRIWQQIARLENADDLAGFLATLNP